MPLIGKPLAELKEYREITPVPSDCDDYCGDRRIIHGRHSQPFGVEFGDSGRGHPSGAHFLEVLTAHVERAAVADNTHADVGRLLEFRPH